MTVYSFFDISTVMQLCADDSFFSEAIRNIFALSGEETVYSLKIKKNLDRARHLCAYALLGSLEKEYGKIGDRGEDASLCKYIGISKPDFSSPLEYRIVRNENGKPYFENKRIFFSVSHSESLVMVAISDRECGADVQKRGVLRNTAKIAHRLFSPDEQALDFYDVFSAKEAVVKALGVGLDRLFDEEIKKMTDGVTENMRNTVTHNIEMDSDASNVKAKEIRISSSDFDGVCGRTETATGEEYSFSLLVRKND